MNLTDLFEEDDEIDIKDPKAKQALNVARSQYGWANNDLEAFIAMVQDQQGKQNSQIDSQFNVNVDQEDEIEDNTDTNSGQTDAIHSLEKRISNLEKGGSNESISEAKYTAIKLIRLIESNDINWEPQPEFKGRGGIATATHDSIKRQKAMGPTPSANRRYQSTKSSQTGNTNQLWQKYLSQLKTLPAENKRQMIPILQKIVQAAASRNVQLTPDPSKFQFLQNG